MDKALIHILIVWSKGKTHIDAILDDLTNSFTVLNVFDFSWDKDLFDENLKRFYSHSQKDKSQVEFDLIIKNKIEHCGDDNFNVIIFEDLNPVFQNRKTSNGISLVNINVFDRKVKYRNLTGGGHKIHASDNYFESNKDISLLFNTNLKDYKKNINNSNLFLKKNNNIVGVPYWESINDLFFVLNNTIDYVVLRNFECLPNDYHVEGHGDIDLLVEDFNYIKYLTGAITVFPEKKYRVYHYININNENVPFDFRYLGDNYYDNKWELDILNNRKKNESFYFPDETNHFYSLLYHAYIHKKKVSKDYKLTLEALAKPLKIEYKKNILKDDAINLLKDFLLSNGYQFSLPSDFSVNFNKKNADSSSDVFVDLDFGELISSSTSRTIDQSFLTEVYQKGDSIIKVASNPISKNEYLFLSKLMGSIYFPSIVRIEKKGNFDLVEIEKINGFHIDKINYLYSFWNTSNIFRFLQDAINILIVLLKENICHRDVRPDNFIVFNNKNSFSLRLIDFGWAINIHENKTIEPIGLGTNYKYYGDGYSDCYSMGLTLKHCLGDLGISKDLIDLFLEIKPEDYLEKLLLKEKLENIKTKINYKKKNITLKNRVQVLYRRIKTFIGIKRTKKISKKYKRIKKRIFS